MAQKDQSELEALRHHLSEVETELARYAAAYGLSDQARALLVLSPLAATLITAQKPHKVAIA